MKRIYQSLQVMALLLACLVIPVKGNAQVSDKMYFNLNWDLNTPFGNNFADKTSGWGAHGEFGYYYTDKSAVGAFVSYHTNNKYIDRQTLPVGETGAITSDQQHSLFQLPFGVACRYRFTQDNALEPYLTSRLGANYSEMSTTMNVLKMYDRSWGVYLGTEAGMNIYLTPKCGLNVAVYYNYSTNKSEVLSYTMNGIHNWGVRMGVAF